MRTSLLAAAIALLAGTPLAAQDNARLEVFGGYQFFHSGNFDGAGDSVNANGWDISATVNLRKQLGITADFTGNYGTGANNPPIHIYTYTFGPVVSMKAGRSVKFFAHALFGGAHSPTACYIFSGSPDECGSGHNNGFSMMFGGGADARLARFVAIRLAQLDWVYFPTQFGAQTSNVRVSTGLVVRF